MYSGTPIVPISKGIQNRRDTCMAELLLLGSEIHSGARPLVKDNFLFWPVVAYEIRRQFNLRAPGWSKETIVMQPG